MAILDPLKSMTSIMTSEHTVRPALWAKRTTDIRASTRSGRPCERSEPRLYERTLLPTPEGRAVREAHASQNIYLSDCELGIIFSRKLNICSRIRWPTDSTHSIFSPIKKTNLNFEIVIEIAKALKFIIKFTKFFKSHWNSRSFKTLIEYQRVLKFTIKFAYFRNSHWSLPSFGIHIEIHQVLKFL